MKALYLISVVYLIALGIFAIQTHVVAEVEPVSPYAVCARQTYASKLHCQTNQYRESIGLDVLAYSPQAESVAKKRAAHLCETDTFTHEGWVDFIDFKYRKSGENLARGFVSPSAAFDALLASPTHKANIEGNWDAMGTYTEPCGGKPVSVQIFTKE